MCKILEDMRNEAELNRAKRMAIRMIKAGKTSLEDIADYTELPLEAVKELESQIMQLA
jgi:DNA-directed RNA polymerase specialized sigma24 family protein